MVYLFTNFYVLITTMKVIKIRGKFKPHDHCTSQVLFCFTALSLHYSRYNQRVARNARRRKLDHFANIQLVETNAVSAAMFLVIRRKIEIHISRFLFLLFTLPSSPISVKLIALIIFFFFITISDEEWKRFLLPGKWK